MQSENMCRLCLSSNNNVITFSSDEGVNLHITNIVSQHFWFIKIVQNDDLPHALCRKCWSNTKDFHEFYNSIENAHESLKKRKLIKCEQDCTNKSDKNNYGRARPNLTANIIHQNENNGLEDPSVNSIKLEVIENDTTYYENDVTFEIDGETIIEDRQRKNKNSVISNKIINKDNIQIFTKFIKDNTIKNNININQKEAIDRIQEQESDELIGIDKINNDNNIDDDHQTLHDTEIIIAEPIHKNATKTLQRDAEDIKIGEFFNLNCQLCSATHLKFTEVKAHYRNVHNSKRGHVICCNRKLFKRYELLEHLDWHLNPNEFRCNVCSKLYRDGYSLKKHMNHHIPLENRNFFCDICGKRFLLKRQLIKHFTHTHIANQNRIYKCNTCDKCFGLKSALTRHTRNVHQFKNAHICHICAKVFKSKINCDIHSAEHFNMEKVQCQICGALLKNKHSLRSHVRHIHQENPIECKYCGKISANKQALQIHIKYVHQTLGLHKCNFCDKTFKRPVYLKEHMAGHTGSTLYTCPYCPKSFNSKGNLYSHKKRSHLIEWQEDRNKLKGIIKI